MLFVATRGGGELRPGTEAHATADYPGHAAHDAGQATDDARQAGNDTGQANPVAGRSAVIAGPTAEGARET